MNVKKYYNEDGNFDFVLYKDSAKKKGAKKAKVNFTSTEKKGEDNLGLLDKTTDQILGTKKHLKKEMNKALKEIEDYNLQLYEDKKKEGILSRRKINKEASKYYDEMEAIRKRVKIANDIEESGLLYKIVKILKSAGPIVKTLARAVASFIAMIFNIKGVSERLKPSTASHLVSVFNMAMAV